MRGYDFLAQTISGFGVKNIFYVEETLPATIREAEKLGVRAILAHSENGAGYMADGYARAISGPGICASQSIGSANLVGGVMDAWLASSPVIAITGKKTASFQHRNSYQEVDHRLLYESVTKFNVDASEPASLPVLLRQAFREVTTGRPRPAHIDITDHTGRVAEQADLDVTMVADPAFATFPAFRSSACPESVELAAAEIAKSERPMILVGRGAFVSGAGEEIVALAAKADIPVGTTPDAKTVIDESGEYWAGIVGLYGMVCANRALREADLVIIIGSGTGDQSTCDWKAPMTTTRVVQIDIDAAELGRNYPNGIGLLGDAKLVTAQLVEAVTQTTHQSWRQKVRGAVIDCLAEYAALSAVETSPMSPARLCREVTKALPDDAVLLADTGFSAIWSATMIRMKPGQRYLRAAGSLGWALPAAIGAKCALPDRPVVCFAGDGAVYYHLSELETASRFGIPVVLVVNNNQALGQVAWDLDSTYEGRIEDAALRFRFPDRNLSAVAAELGCHSVRVENPDDICAEIERALASGEPSVVEVMTDSKVMPPAVMAAY